MALSDKGLLASAIPVLQKAVALAPKDANTRVALGVALARFGEVVDAVAQLREAVAVSPTNPWAFRNLGGLLLRQGKAAEAESHLRRAVELNPADAASRAGLGKCLIELDRVDDADEHLIEAIRLDSHGAAGEEAKEDRTRIAQINFRKRIPGGVRPDAVMYCLGALERFEKMTPQQIQAVGFEIAILGTRGIDPGDPKKRYILKSLPGEFSGVQLLCIMFVAFKRIAPDQDTGFDVSREYRTARAMHKPEKD
jgi:tetratricopeptide (TPR) repeat protein